MSLLNSGALSEYKRLVEKPSLALMPSSDAAGMRLCSRDPGSAGFFSQTGLVIGVNGLD